jgi:hypothetical protein
MRAHAEISAFAAGRLYSLRASPPDHIGHRRESAAWLARLVEQRDWSAKRAHAR